jgi:hypothetical protein
MISGGESAANTILGGTDTILGGAVSQAPYEPANDALSDSLYAAEKCKMTYDALCANAVSRCSIHHFTETLSSANDASGFQVTLL